MKCLISGSSGFIASQLIPFLARHGHSIFRLVRRSAQHPDEISWDPERRKVDVNLLEGFDAIIHLAGENIASGRWTAARKMRILESRTAGTTLLAESLSQLSRRPELFLCASAIGYYGDRGKEVLTERSAPGADFLAKVCIAWEKASEVAARAGVREVSTRFGIILSRNGGALPRMLLPFKFGVGGRLGSGKQYMSWIAIDDVLGAIHHAMMNPRISGPVNLVGPAPVQNLEFSKILARSISRPALFPAPAPMLRLVLGEMADALLLSSAKVLPEKLLQSGYQFRYADPGMALHELLRY